MHINISETPVAQYQQWLQFAIAPRPICFASTIDASGNVNLSPFSFFNLVSYKPAIVVFSVVRKMRDGSTKHTLQNILEVPEVVINICDYDMVQQMSLSSCEFAKSTDEFIKSGFTKTPAILVKPPMVQEAKVQLECKVLEVKSLGDNGGAGQLVIAEILNMHVHDTILNSAGNMIDPKKLALVARLGGDWYCKVDATNLFEIDKPTTQIAIGVDALPSSIRNSHILTGNNLAQLANVVEIPFVDATFTDDKLKHIFQYYALNAADMEQELHSYAKELLAQNNVQAAWQVLLLLAGENV
ncbi:flavin reductase family protein [Parasediminibacterium paludis]|uniref:Flavin reductase family protein n=1 Tax=Parasediminibacterium paludis TaxID=908966 RepID=A0ABV8PVL1_9BACT